MSELQVTTFYVDAMSLYCCCATADFRDHETEVMNGDYVIGLGETEALAKEDFAYNHQMAKDAKHQSKPPTPDS